MFKIIFNEGILTSEAVDLNFVNYSTYYTTSLLPEKLLMMIDLKKKKNWFIVRK